MPRFDADYYRHYYGKNGAHDRRRINHLAAGVHNMAAWWGVNVRSVFDVGAGMGMWRDWYKENHPRTKVLSVDVSEHACKTWGHQNRNIAHWSPETKFDLVVCHSVLQYLANDDVVRAIDNLGASTRHLMYLELPTKWDYENIVDPRATDLQVRKRSAAWYRKHLSRHFAQIGAGLWTPHDGLLMYQLEASR
jgi:trans-aconitate methyltransferase